MAARASGRKWPQVAARASGRKWPPEQVAASGRLCQNQIRALLHALCECSISVHHSISFHGPVTVMQGGTLPASCARSFETKKACVGVSENGGIRQNRPFKWDNYQTPLDFEVRIIKHH